MSAGVDCYWMSFSHCLLSSLTKPTWCVVAIATYSTVGLCGFICVTMVHRPSPLATCVTDTAIDMCLCMNKCMHADCTTTVRLAMYLPAPPPPLSLSHLENRTMLSTAHQNQKPSTLWLWLETPSTLDQGFLTRIPLCCLQIMTVVKSSCNVDIHSQCANDS